MSLIQLRRPWTEQPQGVVDANAELRASALWSGLNGVDVVSGRAPQLSSLASFYPTTSGMSLKVAGTASLDRAVLNCANADKPGSNDFTVLIRFRFDGNTGAYAALGRWNTGASISTCDWYLGAPATFSTATAAFTVACGSSTYEASVSAAWTVGEEYTMVGVRTGTTLSVYRLTRSTGAIVSASTTNAGITTINSNSARKLKLGEIDAGATYNANISAAIVGILPYGASDVLALLRNPWQLFAPRTIPIPLAAAGGGGLPTLSNARATSITTTTAVPVVDYAY